MRGVWTIARNTFREAIRNRIFINLLLFAMAMIFFSVLVATLSIGAERRIILDIGLASITIVGALIAIFLGVTTFTSELKRRIVYTILARPISRASFLLGKYLGLLLVLAVNVASMGLLVVLVLLLIAETPPVAFMGALWLSLLELALIGAIALAFAAYCSGSTLAVILSLAMFVIGSLSTDLQSLSARSQSEAITALVTAFYYILPDLNTFSLRIQVANDLPVPDGYVATASAYGLGYLAVVMIIACLVFNRRELT